MTKTEILSTYTAEQLAEMVVEKYNRLRSEEKPYGAHYDLGNGKAIRFIGFETGEAENYLKAFEDAKKERDCQITEHQKKIEKEKMELEIDKNTINQIDYILEKLFGVRYDTVDKPDEFEKILHERIKGNVTDFLPTEPIKVAEMLINAEGEYEQNPIAKKICGTDKGTYRIFDVSELRQIAEHLLVYCNHNKEEQE